MKPTLHSIAFKFTINILRSCIIKNYSDIYDVSSDYRYKNLRYVSTIGSSNALHYQGGTLAFHNNWMGYFANNAKITLHDIAD